MLTFTGMDLGRLWDLKEGLRKSQKKTHVCCTGCLTSVLEKIAPPPPPLHWKFNPRKFDPSKTASRPPHPGKLPPKIILSVFLFLILFYWVFVQSLKLISLNMFLFLIRIKFFYESLFPYPIMLHFQLHIAKWPTICDYWTK